MSKVEISEFKGHPMLTIVSDKSIRGTKVEAPLISFGLTKAKAIVEHIEDIKQFIADNEKVEL